MSDLVERLRKRVTLSARSGTYLYEHTRPDGANSSAPGYDAELDLRIADELERLYAIEAKLPKTADGVAVVPDRDLVYDEWGKSWRRMRFDGKEWWMVATYRKVEHCYSTRELSQAAAQEPTMDETTEMYRAAKQWDREVDAEGARLIRAGVAPWQAYTLACDIVRDRRTLDRLADFAASGYADKEQGRSRSLGKPQVLNPITGKPLKPIPYGAPAEVVDRLREEITSARGEEDRLREEINELQLKLRNAKKALAGEEDKANTYILKADRLQRVLTALARHKHTDGCLGYAAMTGKSRCIAECADSRRAATTLQEATDGDDTQDHDDDQGPGPARE